MSARNSIDRDESIDNTIAEYEGQNLEANESFDNDTQSVDDISVHSSNNQKEGEIKRRIDPTVKKHVVVNPIPKLNTERLKGPRGIHTIEKYFEGFKYQGHNYEKDDLDRVMKRLEHWAYRLFPKLSFDDMIAKAEKLGAKKDLQTFIKKYRQDMITIDSDLIIEDNIETEAIEDSTSTDAFDLIIAQQIDKKMQTSSDHRQDNVSLDMSTNISLSSTSSTNLLLNSNDECNSADTQEITLSNEIKEKIERNRQLAIKRRLERLKTMNEEKDSIK